MDDEDQEAYGGEVDGDAETIEEQKILKNTTGQILGKS